MRERTPLPLNTERKATRVLPLRVALLFPYRGRTSRWPTFRSFFFSRMPQGEPKFVFTLWALLEAVIEDEAAGRTLYRQAQYVPRN